MSTSILDLIVHLRGDASGAQQAAQQAQQSVAGVRTETEKATKAAYDQEKALQRVTEAIRAQGASAQEAERQARQVLNLPPPAAPVLTQARIAARLQQAGLPDEQAGAIFAAQQQAEAKRLLAAHLEDLNIDRQVASRAAGSLVGHVATEEQAARPTADALPEAPAAAGLVKGLEDAERPARVVAEQTKATGEGLNISAQSVLRVGAGLLGVGLGLNVAAGLARQFHGALEEGLEIEREMERTGRSMAAGFGPSAGTEQQNAAVLARQGGVPVREVEQARLAVKALGDQYGVTEEQQRALLTGANTLARVLGQDIVPVATKVQQLVERGGTAPELGLNLTDRAVAEASGQTVAQFGAEDQGQQQQQRIALAVRQMQEAQRNAAPQQTQLIDAERDRNSAVDQVKAALAAPFTGLLTGIGQLISGAVGQNTENERRLTAAGLTAIPSSEGTTYLDRTTQQRVSQEEATRRLADADKQLVDQSNAVADSQQRDAAATQQATAALTAEAVAYANLALEAERYKSAATQAARAAADAAAFAGVRNQASAAATGALGPNGLIGASPTDIARSASAQAYSEVIAKREQAAQQQAAEQYRRQLEQAANAPALDRNDRGDRERAKAELDDFNRREAAATQNLQAQRAEQLAGRAAAEAQAGLTGVELQSQERQLAVAGELAGYRKEVLGYEGQMAPLLLQQATLEDRIRVASRDNLQTRRALIEAQQAAMPAQNALQDLDYADKRTALLAQVRQSRLIRGQDTSDLPGFDELISQHVTNALDRPAVELAALDANRPVQQAQQQQQGEDLARQLTLTNLEAQKRVLEDQLTPLEQAQRLAEAREASIQRTLELLDLEATAERTAAQQRLIDAQRLTLEAQAAQRAAQDYAAGLERGRDAAKEAADLLHGLLPDVGQTTNSQGITVNVPLSVMQTVDNEALIQETLRRVETELRSALQGSANSAPPVPSTLVGARR